MCLSPRSDVLLCFFFIVFIGIFSPILSSEWRPWLAIYPTAQFFIGLYFLFIFHPLLYTQVEKLLLREAHQGEKNEMILLSWIGSTASTQRHLWGFKDFDEWRNTQAPGFRNPCHLKCLKAITNQTTRTRIFNNFKSLVGSLCTVVQLMYWFPYTTNKMLPLLQAWQGVNATDQPDPWAYVWRPIEPMAQVMEAQRCWSQWPDALRYIKADTIHPDDASGKLILLSTGS